MKKTFSNIIFLFVFFLTLFLLIYPELKILTFNYDEGYSTLLAQSGKGAIREDIYLYYPSYKNLFLGKNFFFDSGNLNYNDNPLPLPYITQILGNFLTIISAGNDNISILLLRVVPLISFLLLYKILINIKFSKIEAIIFSFFTIMSVYETNRFPSPSITYVFFLISTFFIIKSLNSPKNTNYIGSVVCGIQIWVYFHNFVVVAPIFIYSLILRKFIFNDDTRNILKEFLIFCFFFFSYFIFTLIINANIEPSFYEKILWSSDYQEWKDYGIQTTFDDRYKIAIIFISLFTILLFVFKLKENSNFNNFSTLFQSKNFLNYHVFFIIFILTTFFPVLLEKFLNFPQPQVIFIRIGQFQVLLMLCIYYKIVFSFISRKYFNADFKKNINNFFLILVLFMGIFFSYKNILFIKNEINYYNFDFIIKSDEKKLISFLNNQEKCIFASTDKKINNLVNIQSHCRIINANIFNTNLKFDELIERYILVDFLAGYNLHNVLKRFNLNKNFVLKENKICHYNLKKNYQEIVRRDDHISKIFHHGKCDLLILKKNIIEKYKLIFNEPKIYIEKYNFKYLYHADKNKTYPSKLLKKTKIKNLFVVKN